MDQITLERIQLLHPAVRHLVMAAYIYANNKILGKGVRLRFAYTLRTIKEQNDLYALGRSKVNPDGRTAKKPMGNIVTNAKGAQSIHNYGLAFDIVLLIDKDGNGTFETASWDILKDFDGDKVADWMEVVNYFKRQGWTWGGDWKSFPDYPHLEFTSKIVKPGVPAWKVLQERFNAGDVFTEVVNGITYKWVNL